MLTGDQKVFLFLQGPHGPFFQRLGRMVRHSGAEIWRVGFNAGDRLFWRDRERYVAYQGDAQSWPDFFKTLIADKGVTDLVLYGDVRPIHAQAVTLAREAGLKIHVFEEGYMRPYWVTYEREGSNGHSKLMRMSVDDMRRALENSDMDTALPPASWG
ncbi:MAG: capsule biosynthesis protein CapA, partial [Pseudomonadota bacterium]